MQGKDIEKSSVGGSRSRVKTRRCERKSFPRLITKHVTKLDNTLKNAVLVSARQYERAIKKVTGSHCRCSPDDKKSPSLFTPSRSVIVDLVGYEEYKKLAGATVEKYGGKYIVRGGKTEVLEGDWKPKRIVVLEFESAERAREWLNCEEYREPRKMRHRTAKTNMILVEGHTQR